MQQVFRLASLSHRKFLGQQVWLHKGVRTLIVVAPGLAVFLMTGNPLAVTFAFAALCLSVPYGDKNFRPAHLLCLAPLARSALAPLAAFALHYNPLETAEARFLCILIGVIIGTLFMLLFTSERLVKVYAP